MSPRVILLFETRETHSASAARCCLPGKRERPNYRLTRIILGGLNCWIQPASLTRPDLSLDVTEYLVHTGAAASQRHYLFIPPKMLRDAYQAICMRRPTITDLQIDLCQPGIQENTDVWSGLPLQVLPSSTPYRPAGA
jgi:hypothetical protein